MQLERTAGVVSGFLAYTYSRSTREMYGDTFLFDFDRPHSAKAGAVRAAVAPRPRGGDLAARVGRAGDAAHEEVRLRLHLPTAASIRSRIRSGSRTAALSMTVNPDDAAAVAAQHGAAERLRPDGPPRHLLDARALGDLRRDAERLQGAEFRAAASRFRHRSPADLLPRRTLRRAVVRVCCRRSACG